MIPEKFYVMEGKPKDYYYEYFWECPLGIHDVVWMIEEEKTEFDEGRMICRQCEKEISLKEGFSSIWDCEDCEAVYYVTYGIKGNGFSKGKTWLISN